MTGRRVVTTIAVLLLLTTGMAQPRAAQADAGEIAIIAAAAAGAYFAVILVGTAIMRRADAGRLPLAELPTDTTRGDSRGIRFIGNCPPDSGNLTFVCW